MNGLVMVKGADLRVGDRMEFLGRLYTVDRIDPYGPTNMPDIIAPDTRIARSGQEWRMTVFAFDEYRIWPRWWADAEQPEVNILTVEDGAT